MNVIEEIAKIYKENSNIELFIDMDGTIIELLINSDNSFIKEGGYISKRPIQPIINKIEEIKKIFPNINLNIISLSKTNMMKKEKNEWLDIYMPYIKNENRIILCEENNDYTKENVNFIKAEYIKRCVDEGKYAVLIDDDIRILIESKKMLEDKIYALHVTSLLI